MRRDLRVGWRHSLVLRLFALTLVVATVAIAGTAWLAVHTTTRSISQGEDRAAAQRRQAYDAVLTYAATHRDWSGVPALLASLAERTGHRVSLTTAGGRPIAASAGRVGSAREDTLLGVVDPAHATAATDPAGVVAGVDARIAGPYTLTRDEQIVLQTDVSMQFECLQKLGASASVRTLAGGRPVIEVSRAPDIPQGLLHCAESNAVPFPVDSERPALAALHAARG